VIAEKVMIFCEEQWNQLETYFFAERPQSGITACFWHGFCPRAEAWRDRETILSFAPHLPTRISRSHARSPEGTVICWTGSLALLLFLVFFIAFAASVHIVLNNFRKVRINCDVKTKTQK